MHGGSDVEKQRRLSEGHTCGAVVAVMEVTEAVI